MTKRRSKTKFDYMMEVRHHEKEIAELKSRIKTDHNNRVYGRLDAFRYVLTVIEISDSVDDIVSAVKLVINETEKDLE